MPTNFLPYIISWNTTWRCNLRCAHCYLDADNGSQCDDAPPPRASELTTEEGLSLINDIAHVNPETMLILTGGEPLLRSDIFELSEHASGKGLMVVLGTNGNLLNDAVARELKRCGVSGVGVSLDSTDPGVHDSFRGVKGTWEETIKGIEACKRHGLDFHIQTTVTKNNCTEIPRIIEYSKSLGARVFNLFFLVCTGRGQNVTDITQEQYEEILNHLAKTRHDKKTGKIPQAATPTPSWGNGGGKDMIVRARCAPIYRRILYQNNPETPLLKTDASGCLAGTHYCRITPEGDVTPCPYLPLSIGNVKTDGFADIWEKSEHFERFRTPSLKRKCGICEFRLICGGCRARAYASYNDYMDEDDWCLYEPSTETGDGAPDPIPIPSFAPAQENVPNPPHLPEIRWTKEAEERIRKIPFFIRGKVRNAVQQYAGKTGCRIITPEVLEEIKHKFLHR